MTQFKDIAVNAHFSFPRVPGYSTADLGLCVKVSTRRYQSLGKSTIYTVGTTAVDVVPSGEVETVSAGAYRAGDRGSVRLGV